MICTYCKLLTNLVCTNTKTLTISNTKNAKEWICFSCASIELPFGKVKYRLSTNIESDANYTNEHLEKIGELKKHISTCPLNTQSMSSTFDEFQFMINHTKFDVIILSETWLKNDKHLVEYVRLPGYEFAYRNRNEKPGGGEGIYIRDTIEFKVRNDISKLDDLIEHLWVEIQGRKKDSACLIGVFYQPSSENNKKLEWIEKLDSVLSIVKSNWNGNIMITGDSNIDLLASTEIQKRYIEVLMI